LFEIVNKLVRPEREKLKPTNTIHISLRKFWWRWQDYGEPFKHFSPKNNLKLFHPNVSTHLCFAFIPLETIAGKPHNSFALSDFSSLALLQSRLHEIWARFLGSTLGDGLRYTPTDCFETFPFPPDWETNEALEEAGRSYYEYRAALMVRNDEGLTKTYNRFHDPEERSPEIQQLRALHAAMDRAVLAAYGWLDIPTACEFLLDYEEEEDPDTDPTAAGKAKRKKKKPYRLRWPDEVRDEVLAKLLALNAERAAQEKLTGTTKGKVGGKKTNQTTQADLPPQRDKAEDEMV
jgi:hypothetical protein